MPGKASRFGLEAFNGVPRRTDASIGSQGPSTGTDAIVFVSTRTKFAAWPVDAQTRARRVAALVNDVSVLMALKVAVTFFTSLTDSPHGPCRRHNNRNHSESPAKPPTSDRCLCSRPASAEQVDVGCQAENRRFPRSEMTMVVGPAACVVVGAGPPRRSPASAKCVWRR